MSQKGKMKPADKKALIVIVIAVLLIIILCVYISSRRKNKPTPTEPAGSNEQNVLVIDSPKLSEPKTYKNIEISNIKIVVEDNITHITAEVTNKTNETIEEQWVNLKILDKDGQVIETQPYCIERLDPGETATARAQVLSSGQDARTYDVQVVEPTAENTVNS